MKIKILYMLTFLFMLTSHNIKAQSITQLKSCTTQICIEKWILNWEKSFTNEVKILGKLQNRTNRMNRIVQVSERYQIISYGDSKGPIRAWVRNILEEKDVNDESIKYYLNKLDAAQDRCVKVCQDEMNGH